MTADDPRLGRLRQFDRRSRAFSIVTAAERRRPRSYTWAVPSGHVLDQGREGACVGFAVTAELLARPAPVRFIEGLAGAEAFAHMIYRQAQLIDPWPNTPPDEGTSVLAGLQTAHRLGWFREYRWAFGIDDLLYGLGHNGPAVLGIDWHQGMYSPVNGMIQLTGQAVGGHAILARAVKVVRRVDGAVDYNRTLVTLRNSWGFGWGRGGDAQITAADLAILLSRQGEAAFMLGRRSTASVV